MGLYFADIHDYLRDAASNSGWHEVTLFSASQPSLTALKELVQSGHTPHPGTLVSELTGLKVSSPTLQSTLDNMREAAMQADTLMIISDGIGGTDLETVKKVSHISQQLTSRFAAQLPASIRLQGVAKASAPAIEKAVLQCFKRAKASISKTALATLLERDHNSVYSLMEHVVTVLKTQLLKELPPLLQQTVVKAGTAVQASIPQKRMSADSEDPTSVDFTFDVGNPLISSWAQEHALELAKGISDTSAENIRELISSSFDVNSDTSVSDVVDALIDAVGDPDRASMISQTESMRAANKGQSLLWDQAQEQGLLTGNEQKEWIATDGSCDSCADMDGEQVDINDEFDTDFGSVSEPPAHPNCACTVGLVMEQ